MSKNAVINLDGKDIELPIIEGTEGEKAIDIRKLRAESGYITIDSGFGNTGSCESTITFIDGAKGILRYRGFTIEELTEKCSFEKVIYLLMYDKLPTDDELSSFNEDLKKYSTIDNDLFKSLFSSMPKDAHPMSILSAALSVLSTHESENLNPLDPAQVDIAAKKLMAKIPLIAAASYKYSKGEEFNVSDSGLNYTANFLHLMFSNGSDKYDLKPAVETVMNKLFVLHADHEQNCSTSAVRFVGSSQANLFASVVAGVNALSGPSHGGANQKVLEQLQSICDDGGDASKFIAKAKDKADPFRLMGFGHRVYKNFDPRAKLIKQSCDEVLNVLGLNDPLLNVAKELSQTALNDKYFSDRKLYPNVDFYSGIIYKAIGFPVEMFTVLFAIGRLPGWITQWKEMHAVDNRIGRPRQIYSGENERSL
ncbi:MAG: citrate (Si)-synthase [Planctomycetota bacterium]|nr:MAG: citrate (Si)-synthase [Planctomycetota bacterium]